MCSIHCLQIESRQRLREFASMRRREPKELLSGYTPSLANTTQPSYGGDSRKMLREMHPDEIARMIMHGTAEDLAPRRRHEVTFARDIEPGCYQQQLKPNAFLHEVIKSGQTRVTAAERELMVRSFRSNPWAAKRNTGAARFEDPHHQRHPLLHSAPYHWVEEHREPSSKSSVAWPAHASRGRDTPPVEPAARERNLTLQSHRQPLSTTVVHPTLPHVSCVCVSQEYLG